MKFANWDLRFQVLAVAVIALIGIAAYCFGEDPSHVTLRIGYYPSGILVATPQVETAPASVLPIRPGGHMPTHPIRFIAALFVVLVLGEAAVSSELKAQAKHACQCSGQPLAGSQRALVLQGGGWLVDLDATVLAARAEIPMGQTGRWLFVPGLTFAHGYLRAGPTQNDVLVPEALFHYQLGQGRFRPYVGGGAGLSLVNLLDRTINGVVTVASGLRADLGPQWGARMEADLRFFGFEAGSVGWSLGLAHRF